MHVFCDYRRLGAEIQNLKVSFVLWDFIVHKSRCTHGHGRRGTLLHTSYQPNPNDNTGPQMPDSSHFNQKAIQAALDAGQINMSQVSDCNSLDSRNNAQRDTMH